MIAGTHIEPAAVLDRGPRTAERTRMCAATRVVQPVTALIRFVVGPDAEVVPDIKSKLPGRGIWVTGTRDTLALAIKRKAFVRAFRRDVRLPADLAERTERLLERAVFDALAIAGKAGLVATGFAKVEAALERDEVIALVHASAAAPDGVRKLDAAWRRWRPDAPPVVIGFLNAAELDLALNRPNVVHAALLAGPVSETFLARCRRLERFRAGDQHHQAGKAVPY